MTQHIIALGGGGFSMEPDNPKLDQYILQQSMNKNPKIAFIGTASWDDTSYSDRFMNAFARLECQPRVYPTASRGETLSENGLETLFANDIFFVGGGNTKFLLEKWRSLSLHEHLVGLSKKGIVLSGISAGGCCWFEHTVTDSIPGSFTYLSCLGVLSGGFCPHYQDGSDRGDIFDEMIQDERIPTFGYGVEDGAALHFIDGHLARVVSSRQNAKAYFIRKKNGTLEKKCLNTINL